ncbi:dihydrolipoyl dehydrogenase [Buchnera aphidicola]|jgi:dihydrolipoamide dehydrogenase|uniref:Dihydrolipoyl dehydrogenase n=1 Tax=Buchnera aphidicola subsp. Schizaphis graminum (strain Sg) TaxID=198804 RepID=DLDH_BUCAP|nr:dihydrolipoyl dehydrogenase [Buchnera aphidicola]Q8K9T7.1 RecName: Full=Dihydrolipoyl dehydrogenase; AltName: Full=Dihydrolipoamide dehydrogenase; AltName: Full=E3 component of pyruvate and 2-oxoglutarate dehydrogenases complexes [Buchnera aphidicola str. Sg (Schizaphis graminum)]AAM67765.1 dihydrolipoamide dehydrogenase [Buchnera aphidicola str. Sg (Schizaphis graminum)]AWI49738.1 dihydrolipoyl dehydrogenase [Buchnera aphidicola (Schizaphis graminum)]
MHQEIQSEVVIIGSGPAGYSAAFRCADLGLETVLIEHQERLGGVCLNVGCIPSKSLLHIAKIIKDASELSESGVFFNKPIIDIKKINNWKEKIIKKLTTGLSNMGEKRKVRIVQGKALFNTDHSVLVKNKKNDFTIFFKHAIIATGSKPIKIPSLPNEDNRIWNSTDALSLKSIPNRFLIIGGGIIGLEMATIYSALGSKVDIVDRFNAFLPSVDKDITDIYIKSIKKRFKLLLNTHVKSVEKSKDNDLIVKIAEENSDENVCCYDNILVAIGRSPNVDFLGLEKIGLKLNESGFIEINQQLKTNISHIYAIGDVTGFPMLAHKAVQQAHIAAEVISGKKHYFEPKVIPSVAYTDPEIAWVGLSEKEAENNDIDYEVSLFPWSASGRAHASNCTLGMTKLIFNKNTNKIIGGSIIGTNASELISEIGLAIEMGSDAEDISLTIHPHPTLSESISLASEVFQGTITDLLNLKKSLLN